MLLTQDLFLERPKIDRRFSLNRHLPRSPIVMPIKYVLVTGGTGFLGAHVVDNLLSRGLRVRLAVRNLSKGEAIRDARPQYASKLDLSQVADFTANASFEEAVKDVDGIIHVASPLTFGVQDNEKNFLLPAINGVKSVLVEAAQA